MVLFYSLTAQVNLNDDKFSGRLKGKKVLIFGGSGSLGRKLMQRNLAENTFVNFSRDEWKHWQMDSEFHSSNLRNLLGDIRDLQRVDNALVRTNPNIVVIASALKHIERVEYATHESIATNLLGVGNVLDAIERNKHKMQNLETVVFVSTDKACSPVNVYGMCKSLSEKMVIEKSLYVPEFKFVITRYGNVLNSKGSIIPLLHRIGQSDAYAEYTLTHPEMTRFAMTLDESCQLIEDAITLGRSGDIVIPDLKSLWIKDLFALFSSLYDKPVVIGRMRYGEKLHECLINETEAFAVTRDEDYYFVRAPHVLEKMAKVNQNGMNIVTLPLVSSHNPMRKEELQDYLKSLGLLESTATKQ